jgi:UDP-2,4-diacetamido-2,4,6-trideoxy-beta-L-altropyranose hydrolase
MRVLIRSDSSLQIGSGHIYRCMALADHLRQKGHNVDFSCALLEGNLISLLKESGFEVIPSPQATDMPRLALSHAKYDFTVIDHYEIECDAEMAFRPFTNKIISIDDWGTRRHCVDYIIDPSLSASSILRRMANGDTPFYSGLEWAMLRKEFETCRARVKPRREVKKVLLFFGGTDPAGLVLPFIHEVIKQQNAYPGIEFNFLVSRFHPMKDGIQDIESSPNLKVHVSPDSVADLMLNCDFYIGSAGSVTWERMCLGLTGMVLSVSRNQEDLAAILDDSGYHKYIGKASDNPPREVLRLFRQYLDKPFKLTEISENCFRSVDGRGVERIVSLMESST